MRRTFICLIHFLLLIVVTTSVKAQEWDIGIDIFSSYIWRGLKFGSGAAIQPGIEFTYGNFTVGSWGSRNTSEDEALETDLYANYQFELGENSCLELTLGDYYFPGTSFFEGSSHFIEPIVQFDIGKFYMKGAYMIYDGNKDLYMEAGFTAGQVDLVLGSGDGMYTVNEKFNICNISIGTTKELEISNTFLLAVAGSVVFNPSSEQLYIVAGLLF